MTISSSGVQNFNIININSGGVFTRSNVSGANLITGKLTIANGGTFTTSNNPAFTLRGGLSNSGTFTSGTGTYTFNTNSQAIEGSAATTFGGIVAISGAINVTNSNTNTVTITGNITGDNASSTWINSASATVNFKGVVLATGILTATANGNTVIYSGSSAQTLKTMTYHHLQIKHTGTVTNTLPAGTLTVAGNLTIGDGSNATTVTAVTNDPNITVTGTVLVDAGSIFTNSDSAAATLGVGGTLTVTGTLNAGAITATLVSVSITSAGAFNGNTATMNLTGDWANVGAFTAGTSTVNFVTSAATLSYSTVDANTGLMWQKYGHGSSNGYTTPTIVSDCASGGSYSSSYCKYLWQDALKYCSNLTLDSYSDWRLPTPRELVSIVNYGTSGPAIDTTNFLATINNDYYSSTTLNYSSFRNYAYVLEFNAGGVISFNSNIKTDASEGYVRCVRVHENKTIPDTGMTTCYDNTTSVACGGSDFPDQDADYNTNPPSYTTGTYTTTDNNTGLVWQKYGHGSSDGYTAPTQTSDCASGGTYSSSYCSYNWQNSLKYCSNLTLNGQSDWRLPNAKELQSIMNYGLYPSVSGSNFPNTISWNYMTSTTYTQTPNTVWVGNVTNGYIYDYQMYSYTKLNSWYVRCVRGTSGITLPDTGVTKCYSQDLTTSCGGTDYPDQDADYTINAPSYTAGTYSVTDNKTGLVWQRYGHGSSDGYTAPTQTSDCASGGTYSSSYCVYNWQNSLKYCSNLSLDGQTDWRLPNLKELQSIVNYGAISPSIDTTNFLNTSSSNYWSSSTAFNAQISAWNVVYSVGNSGYYSKDNTLSVRCVRGSAGLALPDTGDTNCYDATTTHACSYSEYPDQDGDYTINAPSYTAGTYSTTDNNTGLIWQKNGHGSSDGYTVPSAVGNCASGGTYAASYCTYSWQDALKYCSNLSMDSQTDWRLPNIKELQSIVKYGVAAPIIDTTNFLRTKSSNYWSSSTYLNTSYAFDVDFNYGNITYPHKSTISYVRCVRGSAGTALPDTGQTSCYRGTSYEITCGGTDYPDQDGDYTINPPSYTNKTGSTAHQISGNTTFYNLAATQNYQTLTFVHDSVTSIAANGSLAFTGAAGLLINLQSDTSTEWYLRVSPVNTTVSISYVNVSQSNAGGYKQINASNGTNTNGGNNINWLFTSSSTILTNISGVSMTGVDVNQQESSKKFMDTGQSLCYDSAGGTVSCSSADYPGQDGAYTINALSYTAGTYTVTDNNTGLVWQRYGHGSSDGYTVPTVVGDCASGGTYSASYCTYGWQDALKYCDGLTLNSLSDWRLPSDSELLSIVKLDVSNPSINTTSFLNTESDYYWSSTTYASSPSYAQSATFNTGGVIQKDKSTSYYVRCVRGD